MISVSHVKGAFNKYISVYILVRNHTNVLLVISVSHEKVNYKYISVYILVKNHTNVLLVISVSHVTVI